MGLSRVAGFLLNEDIRDRMLQEVKPGDVVQLRHKYSVYPWYYPPTLKPTPNQDRDPIMHLLEQSKAISFESLCLVIQIHNGWYYVLVDGASGWINRYDIIGGP